MHYINVSDLMSPGWTFLEPYHPDPALSWDYHYGAPANILERSVRRPALGRYRAVASALFAAQKRPDSVLVSHLPGVTLAMAMGMRAMRLKRPHIAFAFNYTTLPTGRRLAYCRRHFADVDVFVVPSRYEIDLYSELFGIPRHRFVFLPWTIGAPPKTVPMTRPFEGAYLCAIGGEGRDYATLAQAMRKLEDLRMVVVARPHSIAGLSFPDNVLVHTNLPSAQTWGLARGSIGMAVPLQSAKTPNGHVSMLAAQSLGIPLAVTRSAGVKDYVDPDLALLVDAGDADALAAALRNLVTDRHAAAERAERAKMLVQTRNHPQVWCDWFAAFDRARRAEPHRI